MLKLHKDSKSKGAGSQQICQLRAAIYKMTISGSGGEQAENCWRLRDFVGSIIMGLFCSSPDLKASLIGCFWRQDAWISGFLASYARVV